MNIEHNCKPVTENDMQMKMLQRKKEEERKKMDM